MVKYLSYLKYAPHVALAIIILLAGHGWNNRYEYAKLWQTPAPPEEVSSLEVVKAECVPVLHFTKEAAIKEGLVPEYAREDDNKQVTAAIDVPAHRAETHVTSVFDLSSGVNKLSYRQEKVSFWELGGPVDAFMGYGIDGLIKARVGWEPLRIGSWYLRGEASIDSDSEAFLGLGVLWKSK